MTTYAKILEQIDQIDPVAYARTRNFIDDTVTRLSPFISRGVISTRMVMERIFVRGFSPKAAEKLIQGLFW